MASSPVVYCFDSSALIRAAVEAYPEDVLPAFWDRLAALAGEERAICPREVREEVMRKSGPLADWIKAHREMVVPIDDDIQVAVGAILQRFRRLVDTKKNKSGGDPWVIATAQVRGAIVVTEEGSASSASTSSRSSAARVGGSDVELVVVLSIDKGERRPLLALGASEIDDGAEVALQEETIARWRLDGAGVWSRRIISKSSSFRK